MLKPFATKNCTKVHSHILLEQKQNIEIDEMMQLTKRIQFPRFKGLKYQLQTKMHEKKQKRRLHSNHSHVGVPQYCDYNESWFSKRCDLIFYIKNKLSTIARVKYASQALCTLSRI